MKLFYTRKQVRGMVEEYNKKVEEIKEIYRKKESNDWFELNSKIDDLETKNKKLIDKCCELDEKNKIQQNLIQSKNSDIVKLNKKLKQANGAKGGFIARINELIKEIEDTKEKFAEYKKEKENEIADLKSDRYLRVTPPTKNRRTNQKMQLYSKRKTSSIIKNVKEKL